VSSHYATGTVHVSNLDSEDEAADVAELIESALRGAGYYVTVDIAAHPNKPTPGETP
jgi:hypothetical protein